ncbi:hypothetical protein VCSRO70_3177 [Vibrio cholerae]|nr:hypothetical protein [Vibrio cholerae]GHY51465.1 hypothetical protein VCSRO70_3177 [Vibrio cholerae]
MTDTKFAPIVIFAFNRPDNLRSLLSSLTKCNNYINSPIYIFIDGHRNQSDLELIDETQAVCMEFMQLFDVFSIQRSSINKGLASSLISGVTSVFEKHDCAIVLEDDLILSEDFIDYMNSSLERYAGDERVSAISGFSTKISSAKKNVINYFHPRPCSWGWATWKDRWERCEWNYRPGSLREYISLWFNCRRAGQDVFRMYRNQLKGKINSWAIRWTIYSISHNKFVSYPYVSRVYNSGFGHNATHCKGENPFPCDFGTDELQTKNFESSFEYRKDVISEVNFYHSNLYKLRIKLGFV